MELSLPPSPSLRQTMSLLRNRRPQHEREREPPAGGPKPREVYGFVGSITTVIATAVYLVWAYTPELCLRSLGITYYPAKYWALAVPSLVMVAVALSMLIYVAFNFLATPPPTSLSTIHGPESTSTSTCTCYRTANHFLTDLQTSTVATPLLPQQHHKQQSNPFQTSPFIK